MSAMSSAHEKHFSQHPAHPLKLTNEPYHTGKGFKCNLCNATKNGDAWHCQTCSYDICLQCAK
jgi:hypothetical protein